MVNTYNLCVKCMIDNSNECFKCKIQSNDSYMKNLKINFNNSKETLEIKIGHYNDLNYGYHMYMSQNIKLNFYNVPDFKKIKIIKRYFTKN